MRMPITVLLLALIPALLFAETAPKTNPLLLEQPALLFYSGSGYGGIWCVTPVGEPFSISKGARAGLEYALQPGALRLAFVEDAMQAGPSRYQLAVYDLISHERKDLLTDSTRIAWPGWDRQGRLYCLHDGRIEIRTGPELALTDSLTEAPLVLAVAAEGNVLLGASRDEVTAWKRSTNGWTGSVVRKSVQARFLFPGLSADGRRAVFTEAGGTVFLADLDSAKVLGVGTGRQVRISADGNRVIWVQSEGDDHDLTSGILVGYDRRTGKPEKLIDSPAIIPVDPNFSGGSIVTFENYKDGKVYTLDPKTGRVVKW